MEPDAQVVQPVQPLPPHCVYIAAVHPPEPEPAVEVGAAGVLEVVETDVVEEVMDLMVVLLLVVGLPEEVGAAPWTHCQ